MVVSVDPARPARHHGMHMDAVGVHLPRRSANWLMNARIIGPLAAPSPGRDHLRILSAGGEAEGRFSLAERIERRGNEPPLHRHRHEDVLIYIVDGHLTVHVDGRRLPAAAGSCVLLPRGTEHGYTIDSETAHFLMILAPAGAERFLAELHGSGEAAGTMPGGESGAAIERLVTVAARHGIDITGPPPHAS